MSTDAEESSTYAPKEALVTRQAPATTSPGPPSGRSRLARSPRRPRQSRPPAPWRSRRPTSLARARYPRRQAPTRHLHRRSATAPDRRCRSRPAPGGANPQPRTAAGCPPGEDLLPIRRCAGVPLPPPYRWQHRESSRCVPFHKKNAAWVPSCLQAEGGNAASFPC